MNGRNERQPKVICWGCGQVLGYEGQSCPECGEPGILADPKPNEVMPICGAGKYSLYHEGPVVEDCCHCGKRVEWVNYRHWIEGPCPLCGSRGTYGDE